MGTGTRTGRWAGTGGLLPPITAALLVLAASVVFVTGPGTAPAAAEPVKKCTATKGAVVAVDFGPWGGKVVRGCDTTPTSGYELLHTAGFSTAGTQHDGPGFICRIGHKDFKAGKQYPTPDREKCRLTPQATAYWSYWIAPPGQDHWSYSQLGAMDRRPKAGDVEAWVYGGTDVGGTKGRPAFSPDDVRPEGHTAPPDPEVPDVPHADVDVAAASRWIAASLKDGERVVGQDEEGAEKNDHFRTTEAAFGLAAAYGQRPALDKTLTRVVDFLARPAESTAYAYPHGTDKAPDGAAVARLALVAEVTGRDPRAFGGYDLLGELVSHRCASGPGPDGSNPGCTAKGDFRGAGYAEGQALGVLALLRGGVRPPADTVARLAGLQCPDGGFTSILVGPGEHCGSEAASTGLIALVLRKAGGHDAALAKARTWLRKAQLPTGGFPGYEGATVGAVQSTAFAAQALRTLGDGRRADAGISWTSGQQQLNGSFAYEEGGTEPLLFATAPAALAGAGKDLVTLSTKRTGPTAPGPDLAKGVTFLTGKNRLKLGRYYESGPGSGFADYGLTIDTAYALAATDRNRATLRDIVDFLDKGGRDGTGRSIHNWTGVGDAKHLSSGSLGKTALLAQVVGRDPRAFGGKDLIEGLSSAVCAAPSSGKDRSCAAKGAYRNVLSVFSQSLGIMAQYRAGEGEAAREPVAYLEGLQHPSGAWPSLIPTTGDSEVDSTAMAAMALDLVPGERSRAAVDRALAWIAGRQLADGGFPGASGNSVNSAALAIQGLSLDAEKYADRIAKARAFLVTQQNADGGFNIAVDGQRGSDVRASAQAVSGATGTSFGRLTGSLAGTKEHPLPGSTPPGKTPSIVTPGEDGSGGDGSGPGSGTGIVTTGNSGPGTGGQLASTGTQAGRLAPTAAALLACGALLTVVARKRRTPAERGRR
ncbi:prenyltransferase/squalene oxidase repeat-containing protein [Streptomyces sp. NPDC050504]|uniref:prenyltransferase/squalene oxidase repeat-containing protein n=1 Tax=Streptomyces sp. NPDC050504 TaxID=3365618 RepID=UPI0037BD94DF